mgnify:CR=1 FL=1
MKFIDILMTMNLKKFLLTLISYVLLSTSFVFADSWSTNSLGITSGTLGGQSFSSSTNSLGITSGSIGNDTFSYSTNSLGITSGSVGNQSFSCSTNSLGITTCY